MHAVKYVLIPEIWPYSKLFHFENRLGESLMFLSLPSLIMMSLVVGILRNKNHQDQRAYDAQVSYLDA